MCKMKKILTTMVVAVAVTAVSCSGGNTGIKDRTPEEIAKLSPKEFANDFNEIWVEGIEQLSALLDKYPQLNADFDKESSEIVDATVYKVVKYGAFLDGITEEEKFNYLLACQTFPTVDGADVLTPFIEKLNSRFEEFMEYNRDVYYNTAEINVLPMYLKFDDLRENHPYRAEKYGIK